MPSEHSVSALPGHQLTSQRMPGHWLLARLGKRVLRPGGADLTRRLITALNVTPTDRVVEFAPGLGATAQMLLSAGPATYTGLEKDVEAAAWSRSKLPRSENIQIAVGTAENTGLTDGCSTVVIGEAMLTMNTPVQKKRIVEEAFRTLQSGGRYGIHELSLVPDDVGAEVKIDIEKTLSKAIHVGARPLTVKEWSELLISAGFRIQSVQQAPMHLLQPARLIADEGLVGALRFVRNVLIDRDARKRVIAMRKAFRTYQNSLSAVALVAVKD